MPLICRLQDYSRNFSLYQLQSLLVPEFFPLPGRIPKFPHFLNNPYLPGAFLPTWASIRLSPFTAKPLRRVVYTHYPHFIHIKYPTTPVIPKHVCALKLSEYLLKLPRPRSHPVQWVTISGGRTQASLLETPQGILIPVRGHCQSLQAASLKTINYRLVIKSDTIFLFFILLIFSKSVEVVGHQLRMNS